MNDLGAANLDRAVVGAFASLRRCSLKLPHADVARPTYRVAACGGCSPSSRKGSELHTDPAAHVEFLIRAASLAEVLRAIQTVVWLRLDEQA